MVEPAAHAMTPHRYDLRIYYEDTDAGGVVYHANYLRFMERARTEMMREARMPIAALAEQEKLLFVVGEVHLRYKASARLDDALAVETLVTRIGGASVTLGQTIRKRVAEGESLLVEGEITLVLITAEGKPYRLNQALRDALHTYLEDE